MITLYPHQQQALDQTKNKNRVAIPGYEGLYEIDRDGIVYSAITNNSRRKGPIKASPNSVGYLRVSLYKNGRRKRMFIHRLVAEIFIPNPYNLPVVNHKDANKNNNSVNNLEWCTQSYNVGETYNNGHAKSTRVFIDGNEFRSLREGSLFLGKCYNYLCLSMKKFGANFEIDGHSIEVVI